MFGSNRLVGGNGDDTYILTSATDVEVELAGGGTDTAILQSGVASCTISAGIERLILLGTPVYSQFGGGLIGTTGASGTGNLGANTITGSAGNDQLYGMGGADSLLGGEGDDLIRGGNGDDVLGGEMGQDTLYGDDGADRMIGSDQGSAMLYGGAGNDLYLVVDDWTYSSFNFIERFGEGIDTVEFVNGSVTLAPNFERLVVTDSSTRDHGLTGNDTANTLIGGNGADTLEGGLGKDRLTGGTGADVFLFHNDPTADTVDTVTDYNVEQDMIYLDGVYSHLGTKVGLFQQFRALDGDLFKDLATGAVDADDRILYDSVRGKLYNDPDGSGAQSAQLIVILDGHPAMGSDIILVWA